MKSRVTALAGLLLAVVALASAAQEPEPPTKVKIYKTPQAAYDAFWASLKKKDFKTALDCLAPESLKQAAMDLAFQGIREREGGFRPVPKDAKDGGDKGKPDERMKPVFEVLDRYGLTEKATRDIPRAGFGRPSKKARADVAALIKKPEAFTLDMLKALDKARPGMIGGGDRANQKLEDVKIEGTKAKGNVVHTFEFKDKDKVGKNEFKQPIEFVKINNGWRVVPDAGRRDEDDDPKVKDAKDGFKDKREIKDR